MIKANELRIGNWVNESVVDLENGGSKLNPVQVDGNRIKCIESGDTVRGIKLSLEIMEKCGYEYFSLDEGNPLRGLTWMRNRNSVCHRSAGPNAPYGGFTFQLLGGITFNSADRIELAYLHQLQNLLYSLTGTELDIKLLK